MRTPHRKSLGRALMAVTPPIRRPLFSRPKKSMPPTTVEHAAAFAALSNPTSCEDDSDDDDTHTLTATGDISMSCPYFVPGSNMALSPPPRTSTNKTVHPMRPRPPARRVSTHNFNKVADDTVRALRNRQIALAQLPVFAGDDSTCTSSDTSMSSEEEGLSPHTRFMMFMKSRDLTRSPTKTAAVVPCPCEARGHCSGASGEQTATWKRAPSGKASYS
ncbi:hypothetical protein C8J57DRAFT_574223 [Mycena rebaudengoi]|nr:hypothetical protein C8J57DRAFT_574223 [Mycena rebaudengoi]